MSARQLQHVNILGGHFNLGSHVYKEQQNGLNILKPHVSEDALHDAPSHEEPARCHPGTQERILGELKGHLENLQSSTCVWIHGPAGAGKTAIMRSFCDGIDTDNRMLASFFFFRSDVTRNSGRTFVPTLVYLLGQAVEELCAPIVNAVRLDPSVLQRSIEVQGQKLLVEPILNLVEAERFPRRPAPAIVVDGLDECEPEHDRSQIISVLNRLSQVYPSPLLIVVASRPQLDIRTSFESSPLRERTIQRSISQGSRFSPVDADIRSFLITSFRMILQTHPLRKHLPLSADGQWPSLAVIEIIVESAAGQFIFVTTVIRFVKPDDCNPEERLQILLGYLKGNEEDLKPANRLNNLYRAIFDSIPDFMLQPTLDMLAICVVSPHFPHFDPNIEPMPIISTSSGDTAPAPRTPQSTREIPPLEVLSLLLSNRSTYFHELASGLPSLVEIIPHSNPCWAGFHSLRPVHKSLIDFLTSKAQAGPDFFIHEDRIWECLYMSCLQCDFWHEDRFVMSIMLQFPQEALRSPSRFRKDVIPYTPEFVEYDYAEGAERLSLYEQAPIDLWYRLACAASFVNSVHQWSRIAWTCTKGVDQYAKPFANYLSTFTSVYQAHPELFVLMALALDFGPSSHQASSARRRYALTSDFRLAFGSSHELQRLDMEEGFGVNNSDGILDLHFRKVPAWAAVLTEAICTLIFGEVPSPTWYDIIDTFAEKAIERREVSPQVSRVVLSPLSFQYAAGVDSNEVGRLVDRRQEFKYLQRFLDTFPEHLGKEQRTFVGRVIDHLPGTSSKSPPGLSLTR